MSSGSSFWFLLCSFPKCSLPINTRPFRLVNFFYFCPSEVVPTVAVSCKLRISALISLSRKVASPDLTFTMSKSRAPLIIGLGAAGGIGYYLYNAGGNAKAAENKFESQSLSSLPRLGPPPPAMKCPSFADTNTDIQLFQATSTRLLPA